MGIKKVDLARRLVLRHPLALQWLIVRPRQTLAVDRQRTLPLPRSVLVDLRVVEELHGP